MLEREKKYKAYRNKFDHLIRMAEKNYYSKKFCQAQNNKKATWKTVNDSLEKNKSNVPLKLSRSFINNNNEKVSDLESTTSNNFKYIYFMKTLSLIIVKNSKMKVLTNFTNI